MMVCIARQSQGSRPQILLL